MPDAMHPVAEWVSCKCFWKCLCEPATNSHFRLQEVHLARVYHRFQQPDEEIYDYALDLVRLGYPLIWTLPRSVLQAFLSWVFLRGLRDRHLAHRISRRYPATLFDAVMIAFQIPIEDNQDPNNA